MIHVDDIIAISPKIEEINRVYKLLDQQVQLKNMGEAKIYLGLEIKRDRQKGSISLHQSKYTKKILDKYRPGIKPITNPEKAIPVSLGQRIEAYTEKQDPEITHRYQQEIGAVIYLSIKTRPDIAYAVGLLSRYMSNPGPEHLQALDKLWIYLALTPDLGLHYYLDKPKMAGYTDADWGGDISTRRSTTGYIFLFRGTLIAWNSKLQKTVALSSCEAEYMALKEAIKEQLYIKAVAEALPMFPPI